METSQEVENLWTEFVATRRPELRDDLIMRYAPLVRLVVGRLGIPSTGLLEAGDLLSHGMIGLINAVDRYDPTRGVRFEAFATARIRGAVIDQLRALNWLPRAAVSRVRQIEGTMARLEQQLGRPATEVEVATELGVPLTRYRQMLFEAGIVVLSLDTPLVAIMQEDEFPTLGELLEDQSTPGPVEQLERQERISLLASALDRLPERERLLLAMYYQEELTMKEISKVMGVSESRVCQLHMQAIMRLRSIFNVAGQHDHEKEDEKGEQVSEVGGKSSLAHGRWHRRWNPARF
ncbi:MAG TPA: FliA/WhiG family RNA polymerase sigma factor [Ktedonobacteraceae bacterium]|nr:FliA/WhiG family RNA polymerase sigma factor [Ktedonobacteraceae bacterium]